jgi:ParB family chromosome partitioning protein
VREALRREQAPHPLPKKVAARLARLDLEALPEEKRKRVEEYLEALHQLLE